MMNDWHQRLLNRRVRIERAKDIYAVIRRSVLGLLVRHGAKGLVTVRCTVPKHAPHRDRRRLLALPARRRRQVLRAIAWQATAASRSRTHLWPPQTGQRRPEFSSDKLNGRWSLENAGA